MFLLCYRYDSELVYVDKIKIKQKDKNNKQIFQIINKIT